LRGDGRTGPGHICVYLALFECSAGAGEWFVVDRRRVMEMAKVKGLGTYYRVIGDLVRMGVVEYRGARGWKRGSWVRVRWAVDKQL
jgi:hypothetical protein